MILRSTSDFEMKYYNRDILQVTKSFLAGRPGPQLGGGKRERRPPKSTACPPPKSLFPLRQFQDGGFFVANQQKTRK